jgi:hypothetical protein
MDMHAKTRRLHHFLPHIIQSEYFLDVHGRWRKSCHLIEIYLLAEVSRII